MANKSADAAHVVLLHLLWEVYLALVLWLNLWSHCS